MKGIQFFLWLTQNLNHIRTFETYFGELFEIVGTSKRDNGLPDYLCMYC